jgi:multidrug efflux pump subunit AcrA (membrane-fusion protein)
MTVAAQKKTQIAAAGRAPAAGSGASQQGSAEQNGLIRLLRVEGEARAAKSLEELMALIANETQLLLRARQSFVARPGVTGRLEIEIGSSLGKIDRNTPLIQSLELELARLKVEAGFALLRAFQLWPSESTPKSAEHAAQYPYRDALWMPIQGRTGQFFSGLLLVRDEPWQKSDLVLAQRLMLSFAQAWAWLATSEPVRSNITFTHKRAAVIGVMVLATSLFPVSLTTLAPLEIVARDPFLVTAPMDGIIESIPVSPGSAVKRGEILVRFASTVLRNRHEVAEREVEVADTRVKKTMLAAVSDMRARHELAIAQAELAVKTAERDYARDMLTRSVVVAERAGLAVFGDKRDILGKPVSTGERIMDIADPSEIDVRISVPVGDSIVLGAEKRAKIFLDSSPLNPLPANVVTSDYHAKPHDGGAVAYRVTARFEDQAQAPRLGLRGTAQLYGGRVALIYYVFRRPLTAARQWIGL